MSRIVYLHGFASSPQSRKARFFAEKFRQLGIAFDAPDLAQGDFQHLTISGQLRVLEHAARGEAVTLMGSSLGGYLAALYAARHPEVDRLIVLAPAFRFAERWRETFGEQKIAHWQQAGTMPVYHYGEGREVPLDFGIVPDAAAYEGYPSFTQPALILQGTRDEVVPPFLAQEFARTHPNAKLVLLDSGHELTDVLEPIWSPIQEFLK